MRDSIQFMQSGKIVELKDFSPTMTVLDYLREWRRNTGVKEGCREGDCGACTVAIGQRFGEKLTYQPVNACIYLVGMLDGKELVTVDDLSTDGNLHPVQEAMISENGSQCGFCTPGIVMSLFTLYHANFEEFDRNTVNDWLSGNLCRCTGYRSIIDAAQSSCFNNKMEQVKERSKSTLSKLGKISSGEGIEIGNDNSFFAAPSNVEELVNLYLSHPDAVLVNGATDVGLWITKQFQSIPKIIWLGRIQELKQCKFVDGGLIIGSTATYADSIESVTKFDKDLGRLWRRIGSKQIRSVGTVGGNIVNGSPIGDTLPVLISLGAEIELQFGYETKKMPLEKFYIDYNRKNIRPGEFLTCVFIPEKVENLEFRCFKVSKRFDQDISSVVGAFCLTMDQSRVKDARITFGGMAPIPKRAKLTELAITGANLSDPDTWPPAIKSIGNDFEPISDHRASLNYRMETARALLVKSLMEISGAELSKTRLPMSGIELNEQQLTVGK